jgi:hypothetical protein
VLRAINERLREECRQLREANRQLSAEVALLKERLQSVQDFEHVMKQQAEAKDALDKARQRIEELERAGKRQAAPFRRDKKKGQGQPGRQPGFRGTYRARPPQIDHHVNVPLPSTCPDCCCPLDGVEQRPLTQIIEEIPPLRPVVTRLTTWQTTCPCCGKPVRSSHALQVSTAQGAAGVHLGPRATALATVLKSHFGLPMRKTAGILKQGFGLSLTAGGLSQLLHRVARKAQPQHAELLAQIRASDAVYADETSWYVGVPNYWLWVFTTPQCTLYHVNESRGHPVAKQVLQDFSGVLVSDCAPVYNAFSCPQHKCIAHHLVRLKAFREVNDPKDTAYLDAWEQFWHDVLAWTKARDKLPPEEFAAGHANLKLRKDALIGQDTHQLGDRQFRTRMSNANKHLLGCLEHRVEPTNNRAERAIRPAVIARKVSCGNKTARGAQTWEVLASRCATLYQQGRDLLDQFTLIVSGQPQLAR